MTYTRSKEYADVLFADLLMKSTQVNHTIHHLSYTEAMPEVMEWVIPVVFLDT